MKQKKRVFPSWLRPLLFTMGGGAAGFLYDTFLGCKGTCPITSSPLLTILYMGVIGWLLSSVTKKET